VQVADIPLVSKAWRIYSEQGLAALMTALRRRIYDRHQSAWFRLPLAEFTEVIPGRFDGSLDFDHPERVLAWIDALALPGLNDRVEIDAMKAREHLFVGALDGDKLIGYIKIGWERVWVVDFGLELEIPAGDYFIIDLFTDPASRGLGAGPFLITAVAAEMKKRGFTGSIMHIRLDKQPMLRTAARTGYYDLGRVDYVSILGRKIFRPHPAALMAAATGRGM
jgi:GNAT superfamily N-acetyltransferase